MHQSSLRARPALLAAGAFAFSSLLFVGCGARQSGVGSQPTDFAPSALSQGQAATAAGTGGAGMAAPMATPIPLNGPIGIAMNKQGDLYVGNSGTNQILVYDTKTNKQLTSHTIHDGIKSPAGLAFDHQGNLYVANYDTREVTVYNPAGKRLGRVFHTYKVKNFNPSGVGVAGSGDVWVASRNNSDFSVGAVQQFSKTGSLQRTFRDHLQYPVGIVFHGSQTWVCDSTTVGEAITVFDANGYSNRFSTPGFLPTYAAWDNSGNHLYTTDGVNSKLAVLDTNGKVLRTTQNKGLDLPYGIAFTKAGNFYIANVGDNTVKEYNSHGKLIHVIK